MFIFMPIPVLTVTLSLAEFLQKSPAAVRLKDTAAPVAPLSWRDSGATPLENCRPAVQEEQLAVNDQAVYSYQQISCLDNVIRSASN